MLAAGLLFSGSAIALADESGSTSSGPSQGTESGGPSGAGSGTDKETGPLNTTTTDTETDESTSTGPTTSQQNDPDEESDATPFNTNEDDDDAAGGDSEPAEGTETPATGSNSATPSTSTPGAETPAPTTPADAGSSFAPNPAAEPPITPATVPTAVTAPVNPMWKAIRPVANAFTTFGDVMNSVPGTLAELRTSTTPVRDAIASVQDMLTTMAGAMAPLTQVPGDLAALFGVPVPPNQPLIGAGGSFDAVKVKTPAEAPLFGPQAGQVEATPVADDGPLFGTLAPRPSLGEVASADLTKPLSVSGTVPLKMDPPRTAQSIFQHVIEAVLVPASLTALAAVALPGVFALLVVAAAGVRLGYRQAKAALTLRASGIARFAGPGPLGVVRSGSLIKLRQRARGPRTTRAVCPEAQPARTVESTSEPVRTLERIA
ncbi:hypothetical protein H7J88_09585 [Mycolicibacterium flavescens]|uniref:Uncharacterized protein n=1 Tax=Mycolicibacterium flavescens TaxID=1776 RepID=A0A1E3RSZ4_MYCFV|nr:hypothetical protein [Mycolicibacterium flavescens]MCV7279902.1 hypothetical protein [Mycolicibacterium flavescens]ODQ92517.1 hypothetical protein BHQ18_01960 [Mycolicibacterium flavescens]